jgi:hypothetical protein
MMAPAAPVTRIGLSRVDFITIRWLEVAFRTFQKRSEFYRPNHNLLAVRSSA